MNLFTGLVLVLAFLLGACDNKLNSASVTAAKDARTTDRLDHKILPRVIYGNDDRLDLFDVSSPKWQNKSSSTLALIQSSKIKTAPNGGFTINTSQYGSSQGLCTTERFYEQVTAAFCSGFLIGADLVLTAGHCIRSANSCRSTKFVFDFSYKVKGEDPKTVQEDDIYSCDELIHSELNNATMNDYAIVRLDRPVVNRQPLLIRQVGEVTVGEPLMVIGHPSGLPTKVAGGAIVRNNSPQFYFSSNLDTYGGNSGSAVFNLDTGVVEGILVRGAQDFKYQNGCYVSNVCPDDGCRGEDVTRVTEILKHVDPSELVPTPIIDPTVPDDSEANAIYY